MSTSLNPQQLTPAASLNRVPLLGLDSWEPGLADKTAYDLLSLQALTDELVQHAQELGLSSDPAERALLPHLFGRCFEAQEPSIRASSEAIARRFGRRLGYLIKTLKRGQPRDRQARPDWDDSYWHHWSDILQIRLGGGLAAGQLGQRLCAAAQAVIDEHVMTTCRLQVATWPVLLPLIGCARSSPATDGTTLVFDFGQSFVKRASASYRDGKLLTLRLLPAIPVSWDTICPSSQTEREQAQSVAEYMSNVMAGAWQDAAQHGLDHSTALIASIASYIIDNQPLARQGGPYALLRLLPDNAGDWIAVKSSGYVGRQLALSLLHDGTAAARTYAGEEHAVVIMLGTALGIGFPPAAHTLHLVDPCFKVERE